MADLCASLDVATHDRVSPAAHPMLAIALAMRPT